MISAASLLVKTEAWSCERHLSHKNEHIFGTMINTRMLTFSLLQNKLVTCISAPHQVFKVLLVGDPQESSQFNLVPGCLSLLPNLCVALCNLLLSSKSDPYIYTEFYHRKQLKI